MSAHYESCKKCENVFGGLLKKVYGEVEGYNKYRYKEKVGTKPENFIGKPHYEALITIWEALQNFRGYRELVKKSLSPCDFFIQNPGFILELDEEQHFTLPRKISLSLYPNDLILGFDKEEYIKKCEELNRKDNDKLCLHRIEQRAWLDTLRDFIPLMFGYKPTVRIIRKKLVWCEFDPNNESHVEQFRSLLLKNGAPMKSRG